MTAGLNPGCPSAVHHPMEWLPAAFRASFCCSPVESTDSRRPLSITGSRRTASSALPTVPNGYDIDDRPMAPSRESPGPQPVSPS